MRDEGVGVFFHRQGKLSEAFLMPLPCSAGCLEPEGADHISVMPFSPDLINRRHNWRIKGAVLQLKRARCNNYLELPEASTVQELHSNCLRSLFMSKKDGKAEVEPLHCKLVSINKNFKTFFSHLRCCTGFSFSDTEIFSESGQSRFFFPLEDLKIRKCIVKVKIIF